jgi:hypothetical protein
MGDDTQEDFSVTGSTLAILGVKEDMVNPAIAIPVSFSA